MKATHRPLRHEALESRHLLSALSLSDLTWARLSSLTSNAALVTNSVAVAQPTAVVGAATAVATMPVITVQGLGRTIAYKDSTPSTADGTYFGTPVLGQSVTDTFTILNTGTAPLVLTGTAPVTVQGSQAADFRVAQPAVKQIAPGGSVEFSVTFVPQTVGKRATNVYITSNSASYPSFRFTISGTALDAPPVLNTAPAAGIRVKQIAPEYVGTNVYHTLYLPTDWKPGVQYPVIVEYPPNKWGPSGTAGTVDDTMLGYWQSGGKGFIWVTMPFINAGSKPSSDTYTWGSDFNNASSMQATADYTKLNLSRILRNYGGDPSKVFLTGFSRGAVGIGVLGLRDPAMADIWAGFLPHSFGDTDSTRLARTAGRPTFVTWGGSGDNGASTSQKTLKILQGMGYPTVGRVIPGIAHTDNWIRDGASATSLAVRQEMRNWIAWAIATHPGTYSISGTVTDAIGTPLAGVSVWSSATHFTYTDADGNYTLAGLTSRSRTVTASYQGEVGSLVVTVAGADVADQDFVFATSATATSAAPAVRTALDALAIDRALTEFAQSQRARSGSAFGTDALDGNAAIARTAAAVSA
jgi:hypothetical protein